MAELLAGDVLTAGYGAAIAIHNISFSLQEGEALALLGRNGTGKTTLINTLVGLTTRHHGTVRLSGRDITRLAPEMRAAAGIGWVPQERGIFRSLSVEENLTAVARPGPWTRDRTFALFPRLAERRASRSFTLSGGEQQMLAIARALMSQPRLLLLDEPNLGLSPKIVEQVLSAVRQLRDTGVTILLVEQNVHNALAVAGRAYVLETGRVVAEDTAQGLLGNPDLLRAYLGG